MGRTKVIVLGLLLTIAICVDSLASDLVIGFSYMKAKVLGSNQYRHWRLGGYDDQGNYYSHYTPVAHYSYQFENEILRTCPGFKITWSLLLRNEKRYGLFITHEFQSFIIEYKRHILNGEIIDLHLYPNIQPDDPPPDRLPGSIKGFKETVLCSNSSVGIFFRLPYNMDLRFAGGVGINTSEYPHSIHASSQLAISFLNRRIEGLLEFRYYNTFRERYCNEDYKPSDYQISFGVNVCISQSKRKINWLWHVCRQNIPDI